jgi:hypothetical protein
MATLPPPSIDNATSETSPLLPPGNGSLARDDIVDERLIGGAVDDDEIDLPEPWTNADRIWYSLLALAILVIGIATVVIVKNSADEEVCPSSLGRCIISNVLLSSTGDWRSSKHWAVD